MTFHRRTCLSIGPFAQGANGAAGGGQSNPTIPGAGAPGSQNDAFHRTSDPLCVGSTVCGSDVRADVSNDALIRETGARFSGTYGDLGNVQVRAVPPSSLGSFDAQQLGSNIVEIRNDLFSGFEIDYSLTVVGHEYAHVLQTQIAGGALAFHRLYDVYPSHYRNPFEFGANVIGRQFSTSITGRYTPNYFPRHGIGS